MFGQDVFGELAPQSRIRLNLICGTSLLALAINVVLVTTSEHLDIELRYAGIATTALSVRRDGGFRR